MRRDDEFAMHNGIAPDGCTCEMLRPPSFSEWNGPEPAEWDQDPLCWVHPMEPGTWWDPIQSATPEWRAFMDERAEARRLAKVSGF